MKYILLDTSVLVNCTLVNAEDADPELLVRIVDAVREQSGKILLPEVIRLEYRRKVPEELKLIQRQTKKFRSSVTTAVLPAPDVAIIHATLDRLDSNREKAATRAESYFQQVASDEDVTVAIPLDGDTLAEAVGYVLANQKPSSGLGRGLVDPDCLIVASVARFARAQNLTDADRILICSDNHKDFGHWDQDSRSHVVADSIDEVIACPVRYYKSPRILLEEELEIVIATDSPLKNALDAYDHLADTIETLRRASAIGPELMENLKRSLSIDPSVIENLRRSMTIDPAVLKNLSSSVSIDPTVMESLRRSLTFDPAVLEVLRSSMFLDSGAPGVAVPDSDPDSEDLSSQKATDRGIDESRGKTKPGRDGGTDAGDAIEDG